MVVTGLIWILGALAISVHTLASSTNTIEFSYLPLTALHENFYDSIVARFLHIPDINGIAHSRWYQAIEVRGNVIVEIDWIFHNERSLVERVAIDECDIVTFVVKQNYTPVAISSCPWSLYACTECGTSCRLPLRLPTVDSGIPLAHGGYFEFLGFIKTLLNSEDDVMVKSYIDGYTPEPDDSQTIQPVDDVTGQENDSSVLLIDDLPSASHLRYLATSASTTEWRTSKPVRLFSNYGKPYDNFGTSLAMHDDVVAVGAVTRDRGGLVYVFYRQGKTFYQDPYPLSGYEEYQNDFFGWSVGVHERTIAVGAYQTTAMNEDMTSVGAVYMFLHLSSGWTVESFIRLTRQGGGGGGNKNGNNNNNGGVPTYDNFGWALGLFKDTLMVGAYGDDTVGTSAGAVYAFDRALGGQKFSWSQSQKLMAPDGSAYDAFGWSVSIHENVSVVGAYSDSTEDSSYVGAVYVYRRPAGMASYGAGTWSIMAKLQPVDGGQNDFFGWAVSVFNNTLAVGSNSWQVQSMNEVPVGAVYTYTYTYDFTGSLDEKEWVMEAKLRPPGTATRHFGNSLALDGTNLLVGAFGEATQTNLGNEYGSAFAYIATRTTRAVTSHSGVDTVSIEKVEWTHRLRLSPNLTTIGNTKFGYSVAVYDGVCLVGALLATGSAELTGAVFAFSRVIDKTALGHPVSETTYLALVSFLPILFGAVCVVIAVMMLFLKPHHLVDEMDYTYDEAIDYSATSGYFASYSSRHDASSEMSTHSECELMNHRKSNSTSSCRHDIGGATVQTE